jgi:hypothetical protein
MHVKPTVYNETIDEINDDNGVRVLKFTISKKNSQLKVQYSHIYKFTWKSPDGKNHNRINPIMMDRRRQSCVIDVRSFRAVNCDTDHYLVVGNVSRANGSEQSHNHRGLNCLHSLKYWGPWI